MHCGFHLRGVVYFLSFRLPELHKCTEYTDCIFTQKWFQWVKNNNNNNNNHSGAYFAFYNERQSSLTRWRHVGQGDRKELLFKIKIAKIVEQINFSSMSFGINDMRRKHFWTEKNNELETNYKNHSFRWGKPKRSIRFGFQLAGVRWNRDGNADIRISHNQTTWDDIAVPKAYMHNAYAKCVLSVRTNAIRCTIIDDDKNNI